MSSEEFNKDEFFEVIEFLIDKHTKDRRKYRKAAMYILKASDNALNSCSTKKYSSRVTSMGYSLGHFTESKKMLWDDMSLLDKLLNISKSNDPLRNFSECKSDDCSELKELLSYMKYNPSKPENSSPYLRKLANYLLNAAPVFLSLYRYGLFEMDIVASRYIKDGVHVPNVIPEEYIKEYSEYANMIKKLRGEVEEFEKEIKSIEKEVKER